MDFATTVGTIAFFAVVALALLALAEVLLPSRRRNRRDSENAEASSGFFGGMRSRLHKPGPLKPNEAAQSSRSHHSD
ncbi:hypothetical protein P9239_22220 [Caballeronia sp. LZ062]|uniref:hypothetical protein n=1 Tax=unclassified Caballeronia TaxID=2646786 RepID=UPI00285D756A|nr:MULTISPECIES: hypothetical protein [unclassified Caballeronia]MDR5856400.1 hypothetical protein [Caballeronia sp. LZ050]MDR5873070.1 hypothetical protein [Caballeronia sp. LZ062]